MVNAETLTDIQASLPAPDWHEGAREAADALASLDEQVGEAFQAIEANSDLTDEAKERRRVELAEKIAPELREAREAERELADQIEAEVAEVVEKAYSRQQPRHDSDEGRLAFEMAAQARRAELEGAGMAELLHVLERDEGRELEAAVRALAFRHVREATSKDDRLPPGRTVPEEEWPAVDFMERRLGFSAGDWTNLPEPIETRRLLTLLADREHARFSKRERSALDILRTGKARPQPTPLPKLTAWARQEEPVLAWQAGIEPYLAGSPEPTEGLGIVETPGEVIG